MKKIKQDILFSSSIIILFILGAGGGLKGWSALHTLNVGKTLQGEYSAHQKKINTGSRAFTTQGLLGSYI